MEHCPETEVEAIHIAVRRQSTGYYNARLVHFHVNGARGGCPAEQFVQLDVGELIDAVEASLAVYLSDQLVFKFVQRDDGTDY